MKRQLVVAILAVVTVAALLVFAACNPATPKQSASGTDAFASQSAGASHDGQSGGSATQSASQDVYVKVTVKWNYEGAPEDTVVTYKNGELETNWTFFERTGFDLVGFAFDADGKRMLQADFNEGFDFSTFVPQENYTCYAIWTKQAPADTYVYMTIKWNYEGAPEDTTVTFTNGVDSEYTVPQREGYTLKNWMVVSGDGATTMIALDAVPDKDMTVYAVWEKDSVDVTVIVTIKWNYEGAPGDSSMTVENGEFTLPEPPKREGFTFVWYAFDADGKNMVPEDGSAPDRDMTVYAIWEPATPAYVAKDGYYLLGTYGQYSEQWMAVSDDQMIAATEEFAAYAKKTFKAGDTVKVCNVKEDKWLDWEKGDAFTYDNYGNAVVTDGGEYEVYVKDGKAYLVKYVEQPQDTVVTVTIKWNYEGAPEDTTVTFTNGVASEYTVPQREGYTLKNWMVVIGDGTTMTIDLDAVPDRDVTVYAVWEKNDVV
ncbi:MAG: InlB B-repeat-containing protein, partial [Clostridia bacterium]|nr:InlB B-repeat-containing protein [Clostridia bacterium]